MHTLYSFYSNLSSIFFCSFSLVLSDWVIYNVCIRYILWRHNVHDQATKDAQGGLSTTTPVKDAA